MQSTTGYTALATGDKVRVLHTDGLRYDAKVIGEDLERVQIHYMGWKKTWDEWIERGSERLGHPPERRASMAKHNQPSPRNASLSPRASPRGTKRPGYATGRGKSGADSNGSGGKHDDDHRPTSSSLPSSSASPRAARGRPSSLSRKRSSPRAHSSPASGGESQPPQTTSGGAEQLRVTRSTSPRAVCPQAGGGRGSDSSHSSAAEHTAPSGGEHAAEPAQHGCGGGGSRRRSPRNSEKSAADATPMQLEGSSSPRAGLSTNQRGGTLATIFSRSELIELGKHGRRVAVNWSSRLQPTQAGTGETRAGPPGTKYIYHGRVDRVKFGSEYPLHVIYDDGDEVWEPNDRRLISVLPAKKAADKPKNAGRRTARASAWKGHPGWTYRRGGGVVTWIFISPSGCEFTNELDAAQAEREMSGDLMGEDGPVSPKECQKCRQGKGTCFRRGEPRHLPFSPKCNRRSFGLEGISERKAQNKRKHTEADGQDEDEEEEECQDEDDKEGEEEEQDADEEKEDEEERERGRGQEQEQEQEQEQDKESQANGSARCSEEPSSERRQRGRRCTDSIRDKPGQPGAQSGRRRAADGVGKVAQEISAAQSRELSDRRSGQGNGVEWAQCEELSCGKWIPLPPDLEAKQLPEHFFCIDAHWDPALAKQCGSTASVSHSGRRRRSVQSYDPEVESQRRQWGGTDGIPLRKHKEQPQLEPRRRPPSCSRKRLRSTESPVCDEDNTPVKRFRGAYWNKARRKWEAKIQIEGRQMHLGTFATDQEAARAYDQAAEEHHGADADLNFPLGHPWSHMDWEKSEQADGEDQADDATVARERSGRYEKGERRKRPLNGWMEEEDEMVREMVRQNGTAAADWVKKARQLSATVGPGRSEGAVKQRWLVLNQMDEESEWKSRQAEDWDSMEGLCGEAEVQDGTRSGGGAGAERPLGWETVAPETEIELYRRTGESKFAWGDGHNGPPTASDVVEGHSMQWSTRDGWTVQPGAAVSAETPEYYGRFMGIHGFVVDAVKYVVYDLVRQVETMHSSATVMLPPKARREKDDRRRNKGGNHEQDTDGIRWMAKLTAAMGGPVDREYFLGTFHSAERAARAVDDAARRLHADKEKSELSLNFPDGRRKPAHERVQYSNSKYRGVRRVGRKWYAEITFEGKNRHLGSFDDEVPAARSYDEAARRMHGSGKARLNFPAAGERDARVPRAVLLVVESVVRRVVQMHTGTPSANRKRPTSDPHGILKQAASVLATGHTRAAADPDLSQQRSSQRQRRWKPSQNPVLISNGGNLRPQSAVTKLQNAVNQLRRAETSRGRIEVTSGQPVVTEWTRHLATAPALSGAKYFWHHKYLGAKWESPLRYSTKPGEESIMVVIPDRAVPGMLLSVDVPDAMGPSVPPFSGTCGSRFWTPMKVPNGAVTGMVYRVPIKLNTASVSSPFKKPSQDSQPEFVSGPHQRRNHTAKNQESDVDMGHTHRPAMPPRSMQPAQRLAVFPGRRRAPNANAPHGHACKSPAPATASAPANQGSRVIRSGYRGVSWDKRRFKWRSQITLGGKRLELGSFVDEEQAARVYDQKAREMHRKEAVLNFPGIGEKSAPIIHVNGTVDIAAPNAANNQLWLRRGGPVAPMIENMHYHSSFRGVSWHQQAAKWQAQIVCAGEMHHIGMFDDELAAARAYDTRARELNTGKLLQTMLNFPRKEDNFPDELMAASFHGVSRDASHGSSGRWVAELFRNGARETIGVFIKEEQAAIAYDHAVSRYAFNCIPNTLNFHHIHGPVNAAYGTFRGVSWDPSRRLWAATFVPPSTSASPSIRGYYPDQLKAARAYDTAALAFYTTSSGGAGHPSPALNFPLKAPAMGAPLRSGMSSALQRRYAHTVVLSVLEILVRRVDLQARLNSHDLETNVRQCAPKSGYIRRVQAKLRQLDQENASLDKREVILEQAQQQQQQQYLQQQRQQQRQQQQQEHCATSKQKQRVEEGQRAPYEKANDRPWTSSELTRLLALVERDGLGNWGGKAKELGSGRTASAAGAAWRRYADKYRPLCSDEAVRSVVSSLVLRTVERAAAQPPPQGGPGAPVPARAHRSVPRTFHDHNRISD